MSSFNSYTFQNTWIEMMNVRFVYVHLFRVTREIYNIDIQHINKVMRINNVSYIQHINKVMRINNVSYDNYPSRHVAQSTNINITQENTRAKRENTDETPNCNDVAIIKKIRTLSRISSVIRARVNHLRQVLFPLFLSICRDSICYVCDIL